MRRKGHAGGHKVSVRVTLAVTFSVRTAILLFFFPCTDAVMQFSVKNKCMEINTHAENSSKAKGQMLRAVQVRQRFQSDRRCQTSQNIWKQTSVYFWKCGLLRNINMTAKPMKH